MSNIIVLGAGMVGSAMAMDLAQQHDVTVTDLDSGILKRVKERCPSLDIQVLDVTDNSALQNMLRPFDLVICAVPGFLGFNTLKQIILAGKMLLTFPFSLKIHWNLIHWPKQTRLPQL